MEGADWKHRGEVRGLLEGSGIEFGAWIERAEAPGQEAPT